MTIVWFPLLAALLLAASGAPALLAGRRSDAGQSLANALVVVGSLLGIGGVVACIVNGGAALELPSFLPFGNVELRIDALSTVFLLPIFVVPALGSIFGLGYWKQSEHPENGRKLRVAYGLLAGSMALVVMAHDAIVFLFAWEAMALGAFFLVSTEDHEPAARRAAWIYLVATHVGTLCLFALFALLHHATGSFVLEPGALTQAGSTQIAPEVAKAMFLLALCGFGVKCGIMPLHVWLPGAHANAPSHVSAVLSGVMLKVGVYGFLRITSLVAASCAGGPPAWWGGTVLALGVVSGLAGIAFALEQRDLKRALAYSSIENIGIVFIGIGLALIGRSSARPEWVALGLAGALLHVLNHSLFKPLLFFGAGSVVHATGTRDIEKLGGLSKRMPRTAALFVIGALAICALPPLNGFVSEWLLYNGLIGTMDRIGAHSGDQAGALVGEGSRVWAAFAAPLLAMIGALALACFVKILGAVFLGEARSEHARNAHESPASMIAPMVVLAAACVSVSLAIPSIVPLLEGAVRAWSTGGAVLTAGSDATKSLAEIVPLQALVVVLAILIGLVAAGLFIARVWNRGRSTRAVGTWDCGYPRPTPRIQYTGSSFSQALVWMLAFTLWPRTRAPRIDGPFPKTTTFRSSAPDTVLDRLLWPAFRLSGRRMSWFRLLQQGRVQIYLLYVPMIVLILLLIA